MGDLLSGVFDFLGGTVASALESFVVWLYQLVVVLFQVMYQLLQLVAHYFTEIARSVAGFFDRLWNGFFKSIFTKVWNAVKAAQTWLESKLRPLINFLKKIRQLEELYFNRYIRPILLLIQHVRQYLQILSLLHIHFAQKLDAYLAQLQAKIVQSFATVIGTINTLIDITNAIMDPRYLLRKPTLLLSIRRQIPALIRVITGRPAGYFFPSPRGKAAGAYAPVASNFNWRDSSMNPPASTFLGSDDGIGDLSGSLDGFQFANTAVDGAEPIDYFDDDLYPPSPCTDPVACLARAVGIYTRT